VWVAAGAGLACATASRALALPVSPATLVLAVGGTLAIYNVDRLRDLARDRETSPLRTAFVSRHASALRAVALGGGAIAGCAALLAGARVAALAVAVLAVGLLHRRLKFIPFGKAFYIAAAWTAVVAGVPALAGARPEHAAPVMLALFLALFGNAVASSVRDGEAGPARIGLGRGLAIARLCAVAGFLVAARSPEPAARVLWIPLMTALALFGFRPSERYGLVVLDGALVAGGALGLLLS
jgi:4-hydroxybenzoate polyprenyltransferase